jgi:hypothetical protein
MPIYLSWPSIIVALIVFWPVGLWLLATRIGRDKLARLKVGQSLVTAGIAFLIVGGLIAVNAIVGSDDDPGGRVVSLTLSLVLGWLPGAVLVWKGRGLRAQGMEIRKYLGIITKQEVASISAIAAAVNLSPDVVIEDLSRLIETGYLAEYRLDLELNRIDRVGSKGGGDDGPSRELRAWTCGACGGGNKRYTRIAELATCEYCGVAQSA